MTLLSPGIEVKEKDLTAAIARAATGRGATVGKFQWGPAFEIVQVTDETDVVNSFGLPDDYTYASFYSLTNFLSYANDARVVRVVDEATAKNASPAYNNAETTITAGGSGYSVGDTVTVTAADGSQQIDRITLSGAPTDTTFTYEGDTYTVAQKQVENIAASGTADATVDITVDGNTVSLAEGDDSIVSAGTIAAVLDLTADWDASAAGNIVTATREAYGLYPKISNVNENNVSVVSTVVTPGESVVQQVETITVTAGATGIGNITFTPDAGTGIAPVVVAVTAGDNVSQVASAIASAFDALGDFSASALGAEVTVTYVDADGFDAPAAIAFDDTDTTGVTAFSAVTTAGNAGVYQVEDLEVLTTGAAITINIGGVDIVIPVNSNSTAIATIVENAFNLDANYTASPGTGTDDVDVVYIAIGPQASFATTVQNGVTLTCSTTIPGSIKSNSDLAIEMAANLIAHPAGFDAAAAIGESVRLTYTATGPQTPFASVTDNGITAASAIELAGTADTILVDDGEVTAVDGSGSITAFTIPTGDLVAAIEAGDTDENLTGNVFAVISTGTGADISATIIRESAMYFPNDDAADEAMAASAAIQLLNDLGLPSVYGRFPGAYGDDISVDIITYADYIANQGSTIDLPIVPEGGTETVNLAIFAENGPQTPDQYGVIVKYAGEVQETWVVSTLDGDKDIYGNNIYITDFFKNGVSSYIMGSNDAWVTSSMSLNLGGGSDEGVTANEYLLGWDYFADPEIIYVNLLFAGGAAAEPLDESSIIQKYIVNNIAEVRRDCVAFVSPPQSLVVNQSATQAVDNVVAWRKGKDSNGVPVTDNLNVNTSFAVLDGSYKLQQDKYADKKRWIPLSADIAGLCAFTDQVANPWDSPGGYNRGLIKNVIKLAYDPKRGLRDKLYEAQVNPIVNSSGLGFVMLGDKTMQAKPSAFDRINVRRLFNLLEKAISDSAKFKLFQNNTEFTRNSFTTEVTAYLDNIQAQGGVTSFYVQCDERNNPPVVIDRNEFVGSIYIAPPRSINFITLNFVATETGANFEELIGQAF